MNHDYYHRNSYWNGIDRLHHRYFTTTTTSSFKEEDTTRRPNTESYNINNKTSKKTTIPTATATTSFSSVIKKRLKPFLFKCHPDTMQKTNNNISSSSTTTSMKQDDKMMKQINLNAIQNINHYLDTTINMYNGKPNVQRQAAAAAAVSEKHEEDKTRIVEIDFIITLNEQEDEEIRRLTSAASILQKKNKKKKKMQSSSSSSSRRKVELLLPSWELYEQIVSLRRKYDNDQYQDDDDNDDNNNKMKKKISSPYHRQLAKHSMNEISKLLKVAGLPVPEMTDEDYALIYGNNGNDEDYYDDDSSWATNLGLFDDVDENDGMNYNDRTTTSRHHHHRHHSSRFSYIYTSPTPFERNRERFTRQLDWNRINEAYKEAIFDMHADFATKDLIRNNQRRKRHMIANTLARTRRSNDTSDDELNMLDELITFRRLSMFLDEYFDELQLDDMAKMWETCQFVLGPIRTYNTSRTSIRKRLLRGGTNGYFFTLHPDMSVTIQIPIDFRNDELLHELKNNLWDFQLIIGDVSTTTHAQKSKAKKNKTIFSSMKNWSDLSFLTYSTLFYFFFEIIFSRSLFPPQKKKNIQNDTQRFADLLPKSNEL